MGMTWKVVNSRLESDGNDLGMESSGTLPEKVVKHWIGNKIRPELVLTKLTLLNKIFTSVYNNLKAHLKTNINLPSL